MSANVSMHGRPGATDGGARIVLSVAHQYAMEIDLALSSMPPSDGAKAMEEGLLTLLACLQYHAVQYAASRRAAGPDGKKGGVQ
jgi:hypothetical protein